MSESLPDYINNQHKILKSIPIYNKLSKLLDIKGNNLFLYGYNTYKMHLLYNILNDKVPLISSIHKINNISYIKSNYHFEFDFINNKSSSTIIDIMKGIFINNLLTRYIILINFDKLSSINKYRIIYLLKQNKLSIIIILDTYYNPLKNYGLFIKIPDDIKYNNDKYKINNNIYNNIINKIVDIYQSSINNIKELSYLLNNFVDFNIFLQAFLSKLLENNTITNLRKTKIINFFTEIQYKYKKSYYKIIYYEYIILNVYNICYL